MKVKTETHQFQDACDNDGDDDEDDDNEHRLSPPEFIRNCEVSESKMIKKSSSNLVMGSNQQWSMGSLMAALPLSPSSFHSTQSESPTLPCDFSRASTEFYSPTHQDMKTPSFFSKIKKHRQSPKCMSISTSLYESATDIGFLGGIQSHGFNNLHESSIDVDDDDDDDDDDALCPALPPVPEEMDYSQRKGINNAKQCEEFERAIPVMIDEERGEHWLNQRPKPYQEFLDEVDNHNRRAEFDAMKKAKYTHLLRKLRRKEAAIDEWESKQRSRAEFQLDKLERKLEKKRTKAVQKMHKKLAETKLEAEKRKAKARRSVLKEMAKLPLQVHKNKTAATQNHLQF